VKRLILILSLIGLIIVFNGCEVNNLDIAKHKPMIDLTLPVVDFTSIKTISTINSIALEWKATPAAPVKGYNIYRSNMKSDGTKFQLIAKLKNKYITHYLDTELKANNKYSYSISSINSEGVESSPSEAIIALTLPNFNSVSLIQAINNLPRQIKILWRPHSNPAVSKYILERTSPLMIKWKKLAEIENRYRIEYIDKGLGDNEKYSYRIRAVTFDNIKSNSSKIVTAITKSLPSKIKKFSATRDMPKNIKISWKKSDLKDIVYYNIYRSSQIDGSFKKLAKVPTKHNRFDNTIK